MNRYKLYYNKLPINPTTYDSYWAAEVARETYVAELGLNTYLAIYPLGITIEAAE